MARRRKGSGSDLFFKAFAFFTFGVMAVYILNLGAILLGPLYRFGRDRWQARAPAASSASSPHPIAPFERLSLASAGSFLSFLIPRGLEEREDYPRPVIEGETMILDEPRLVQAGKIFEVTGTAFRQIQGDFKMTSCLDVGASKFGARDGSKADDVSVEWLLTVEVVSSQVYVIFDPASRDLGCGLGSPPLRVPRETRRLCIDLSRVKTELAAQASIDGGKPGLLCRKQGPSGGKPTGQVETAVYLWRPEGEKTGRDYAARGRGAYRFPVTTLTCLDPKGCLARAD